MRLIKLSERHQRVLNNLGSLSVLQASTYLFPLITLPHQVNALGAGRFGAVAFAMAVVAYFKAVVDYGFELTGARDVAQQADDRAAVSAIFSRVMSAKIVLLVFSFAILMLAAIALPSELRDYPLLIACFLSIPAAMATPDWFFQGLQQMRYIAIFGVLSRALFCVAIFVFVRTPDDYIMVPVISAASMAISGVFSLLAIWRGRLVEGLRFSSPAEIMGTLKVGYDSFLSQFVPNFYSNLTTVLLGIFATPAAVGVFEAARRLTVAVEQMVGIISRAAYPHLCRHPEDHKKFAVITMGLTLAGCVAMIALAPMIIAILYGPEISEAVLLLQLLTLSVFAFAAFRVFGPNYLLIHSLDRKMRNVIVVASLIGAVAALVLVPLAHGLGAALALLVARTVMALGVFHRSKQHRRLAHA